MCLVANIRDWPVFFKPASKRYSKIENMAFKKQRTMAYNKPFAKKFVQNSLLPHRYL